MLLRDQERFIPGMQDWFNIHKSISIIHNINNLQKIHMTSSNRKSFDKFQKPPIIIKTAEKQGSRNFRNCIKSISKPLRLPWSGTVKDLMNPFPRTLGTGRDEVLSTASRLCAGSSWPKEAGTGNKDIGWKRVKLSSWADSVTAYTENLEHTI